LDEEAIDAVEHAFRVVTAGVDLATDVHAATQALDRMVGLLAKAPRPTGARRFREERILSRLATRFGISEGDIRTRLAQLRRGQRAPAGAASDEAPSGAVSLRLDAIHERAPAECELVELVLAFPELLPDARAAFAPAALAEPALRKIYETACRLADSGTTPDFNRLMLEFDQPELKSLLVELDQSPRTAGLTNPDPLLEELIETHKRTESDKRLPTQLAALKDQGLDESQKQQLLQRMMEELRTRHGVSDPTDG
jgi:DNA primase